MEMQLEVSEEYSQFLHDIQDKGFLNGCYMDETEYDDKYSHNKIQEAMKALQDSIKEYIHKNMPGEFVVYSDWSIHVIKKEKAAEIGMLERTIKNRIAV